MGVNSFQLFITLCALILTSQFTAFSLAVLLPVQLFRASRGASTALLSPSSVLSHPPLLQLLGKPHAMLSASRGAHGWGSVMFCNACSALLVLGFRCNPL